MASNATTPAHGPVRFFRRARPGSNLLKAPPELIHYLTLFLHRRTLIRLACTCKTLARECHAALCRTTTIHHPGDPNFHPEDLPARQYSRFVRWVRVKSDVVPDVDVASLAKIRPLFPGIIELELQGGIKQEDLAELGAYLGDALLSLTLTVYVERGMILDFSFFRHLRSLDLTLIQPMSPWGLDFDVDPFPIPMLSTALPALHTLSIVCMLDRVDIIELLSARWTHLTLFELSMSEGPRLWWDERELVAFAAFLRAHPRLVVLRLPRWELPHGPGLTALAHTIAASRTTHLRTSHAVADELAEHGLRLGALRALSLSRMSGPGPAAWPDLRALRVLHFALDVEQVIVWRALVDAYPALEHVVIDLRDLTSGVQHKLPRYIRGNCPSFKGIFIVHEKTVERYRVSRLYKGWMRVSRIGYCGVEDAEL